MALYKSITLSTPCTIPELEEFLVGTKELMNDNQEARCIDIDNHNNIECTTSNDAPTKKPIF